MVKQVKKSVQKHWSTTKVVTKNVVDLANATALVGVAGFAIYESIHERGVWYRVLLLAGVLIAVEGAHLLLKHFNQEPKKDIEV